MPKSPAPSSEPIFFEDGAALRRWLEKHHATATQFLLGFWNKASGRQTLTYFEALDEALCFGWIDGVRRSLDENRYVQRFSPRKAKSTWSLVNVKKAEALIAAGRMAAPGLAAFEAREPNRTGLYSFEQGKTPTLGPKEIKKFKAKPKAWAFWSAQPPFYRRVTSHWVVSAKKEETKERRLKQLIADSAKGRRVGILEPKKRVKPTKR